MRFREEHIHSNLTISRLFSKIMSKCPIVGENNPEMYSFTDNWVSDMVKMLSYLCFAFETITPDK